MEIINGSFTLQITGQSSVLHMPYIARKQLNVANALNTNLFSCFGVPLILHSDNG